MAKKTISVYRRGDSWVAKKPDKSQPSAVRDSQKEAYLAAKKIALREGRSITVYYANGQRKVITPKENQDDDCFITTACVRHFRLSDDCHELTVLRNFRDSFMIKNPKLYPLVEIYYLIAPDIVNSINAHPNKIEIYKNIFEKVKEACHLIESNEYGDAIALYTKIINDLTLNYFE